MQEEVFNELAELALKGSGQAIPKSKSYLIEARLAAIARREGFGTMADLVHCLKSRANPVFAAEVASALVSKDTCFFRDRDALKRVVDDVLPKRLKASNTGRLKVWCAGGSTGQEAYSLAILLEDELPASLRGAKIDILSTDICKVSTETARVARYGHYEVQKGLSIHRLVKHFTRLETGQWEASEALRSRVSFRQHNLLERADGLGNFDVILCRNVLSEMARASRTKVIESVSKQMMPGGMILLGGGESVIGLTDKLEPARHFRGGWVAAGTANAEASAA
ncbi:MAG: protein-glutamate O-methyltransferase CheR [Hyphomonas sp.]|jgi:chemotaxis protein methyltransferase CheR|uniref:protein-glutamate O-methyltransferase n=1 Tax=hydrothermal vent metagenome TaxID=652676 RepID=A0A160TXP5_9ZZZZ|nr:protein-glutamate O-methyltransferase CheR [Hyphomonas sp.]MDF1805024.1 protein-glutamate O-methyltransferase CheR [Hyphomonas sp.]